MKLPEVVHTIQAIADNPDHGLDINQVHSLYVAVAVLNSLPDDYITLLDAVLDLATPTPHS
ncbi:MAG: hypothetical protein HWN68_20370 [Desulfobacterales bacterium]|nr:hypothetical protein [Desulfobacterales bacterium]